MVVLFWLSKGVLVLFILVVFVSTHNFYDVGLLTARRDILENKFGACAEKSL